MLKRILKKILPKKIKDFLIDLKIFFMDRDLYNEKKLIKKYSTKQVSLGNANPDKTIMLIRTKFAMGEFSFSTFLYKYCMYAEKKSYFVVADQQTWIPNFLGYKGNIDFNPWELYFKQPFSIDLEQALQSKNVIIQSPLETPSEFIADTFDDYFFDFKNDPKKFGKSFSKYIALKDDLKREFDEEFSKLIYGRKKILGVAIRRGIEWGQKVGSSYSIGHHCDSNFQEKITFIKNKMVEWNCDSCFVTCDDQFSIELLQKEFGNKLFFINRLRYSYFKNGYPVKKEELLSQVKNELNHKIQKEKDYIKEIYFLSKCNALISSNNGGSIAASLWNCGKYEHISIENVSYERKKQDIKTRLKEINGVILSIRVE